MNDYIIKEYTIFFSLKFDKEIDSNLLVNFNQQ